MRLENNVLLTTAAGLFLAVWTPLLVGQSVSWEEGSYVSSNPSYQPQLVSHIEEPPVDIPWDGANHGIGCRKCTPGWTCNDCMVQWPDRSWFQAEYLAWIIEGDTIPALVTSAAPGDPPGLLGEPTTSILFGGAGLMDNTRSGYRATVGHWFNDAQTWAVEGDYFALGNQADTFSASSAGDPVLARPFYNVVADAQASHLLALNGIVSGSTAVLADANYESAGARIRMNAFITDWDDTGSHLCGSKCGGCSMCRPMGAELTTLYRLDLTAGYRWAHLDDQITIRDSLVAGAAHPNFADGSTISILDSFRATNEFQGGELGYSAAFYRDRWMFELLARLAMGNNRQTATINGSTIVTAPGPVVTAYPGGVLALPTNIGRYERTPFVVIPQFGAEVGYQLTPRLHFRVGYDVVMWSSVVRAGEQIDSNINPTQIPPGALAGQASPAFVFETSSFFTHGVNVGAELRY